jgi:glycine hydroxymethyltransferase
MGDSQQQPQRDAHRMTARSPLLSPPLRLCCCFAAVSLSHGYASPTKKVSAVSQYFEVLPYRLVESTGLIDYDTLEANARLYRPKLIVTGASAYARHIDYARMRKIADINSSLLMVDMAHISGLVAAGVMPSPFPHADIVTTTTHKSLRGPRGAMIFFRSQLADRINAAVFPGHQGGPHNHTIAALAVALKQAMTPDFKQYQQQVLDNCQALAQALLRDGYQLVSGGTDNHLMLIDLRPLGINGGKVEKLLEAVNVAVNKNTVPGDSSAMNPGGIRLGSPALTSRGMGQEDFVKIAGILHRGIGLAREIQKTSGVKLVDFRRHLEAEIAKGDSGRVGQLKAEVVELARQFPAVGFDEQEMKYKV